MTNSITLKDFIIFFMLGFISICIWQLGPHLFVANHYPLLLPEKRFVVIITLFSAWVVLKLTFSAPRIKKTITHSDQPETVKKLKALQGRFQGVVAFLKKVHLSHLPWYLVIGPKNAGKTSLLAHSNINFVLAKQFKPETLKSIAPSEQCDWWVTRDLVLLDVPSTYTYSKDKNDKATPRASLHQVLWHNLLNLIREHREESLNGVVIALNLPEMMRYNQFSEKKSVVTDIKFHLKELRERFGKNIPCYLVITKCDFLPGFLDFFGESGSDETAQYLGITLPTLNANDKLIDIVSHHFNILLKRINKQLIWRLHQERNLQVRTFIKDFPLHMERLKETTNQFLKSISTSQINLHGIFFTSALQQGANESPHLTIDHSQALSLMQPPIMPSRPYFIRQLILQGLLHNHVPLIPTLKQSASWQRYAIYAVSASLVLTTGLVLGRDFEIGVQKTHAIQTVLMEYQNYLQSPHTAENYLIEALPLLDALHDAAAHGSTLATFFNFYSAKSQQTAEAIYQQALQTIAIPIVKNTFEKSLASSKASPSARYAMLKAYLMLGDASRMDPDFIEYELSRTTTVDKDTLDALMKHISSALKNMHSSLRLNQKLITNVRKALLSESSVSLGLIILENTGNNNLNADIMLEMETKKSAPILNLYTASAFQNTLTSGVTEAALEATQGNWILGLTSNEAQNTATVTEQLRNLYLTNYIKTWESKLNNIEWSTPKNLEDLDKLLISFTSDHSSLLQTLQTIQQNTAFAEITGASVTLQSLNTLLANASSDHSNYLYETFTSLKELHLYIQNILNSTDVGHATFSAAKAHSDPNANDAITNMHTLAADISDPMKTWLNDLANETWNVIVQHTALYIDNNWQKQIIEPFADDINKRFPFERNAAKEVPLQSFIDLFGQPGALNAFYQNFILPFSTVTNDEIHWRTIDQLTLPLNDNVLKTIVFAQKIQHAFFPNGDNKLFISFSLQPLAFSPDIKSFGIDINGQTIGYTKGTGMNPHVASWPGNNIKMHGTTLNVATNNDQSLSTSYHGDWGWFRLVEQAIQGISSRKELLLEFTVDGKNARYQLFTEGRTNPFLPENIEKFNLPDKLLVAEKN